jgi:GNAT superfamily N-acetyltransferase
MYRISSPISSEEFELYYALRYAVLRAPWNQPPGSEKDAEEASSTHAMLTDESGQCLAVGRLQLNTPEEGQIRFMAVHAEHQGKGLGRLVLRYLEEQARLQGAKRMILQARENALNFYLTEGYENAGQSFKLWDIIQHYKMEKVL